MEPTTHLTHRLAAGLATATVSLLVAASPAAADSIAYVKGGDLWLATPDGARQHQVTTDGGYSAVTQADNGRLVGLRGDHLRYLDRDGSLVADITTPVSAPGDGSRRWFGPFDPAISPDGTKVAYDYAWEYAGTDPNCPDCSPKPRYQGTGFTKPYEATPFDAVAFKRQSTWTDPSWVGTDNEVMLSNSGVSSKADVVLYSPGTYGGAGGTGGGDGNYSPWFSDGDGDLADGEMSRDETKMAFVGDSGGNISIWRGMGGYPYLPFGCYSLTGTSGEYASPSWSPDGARLAFADDTGISTLGLPDLRTGCGTPAESEARLVIPGGSSPDWGPADVPAPRTAPVPPKPIDRPVPPAPKPVPPKPVTPVVVTPGPVRKVAITVGATKLEQALGKGLTVRLKGAKPGRHKVTARFGARAVGAGTVAVAKDGTGRAVVRFSVAGRRALARKAKVSLVLKGAGATRTVTLRR